MPPKQPQLVQTATSSVTNTKLAIATIALLAAGSLAFATVPLTKSMSYTNEQGQKCGVNSFSLSQNCKNGYRKMQVTCHDGTVSNQGSSTSCKPASTWTIYAETLCKDRCQQPPAVSCTDSDGTDINTKGTITLSTGSVYSDSCPSNDPTKVWEGVCRADGSYIFNALNCTTGATCQNGACVTISTSTVSQAAVTIQKIPLTTEVLMPGTMEMARLRLTATNDDIDLRSLALTVQQTMATSTFATSTEPELTNWKIYISRTESGYGDMFAGSTSASNRENIFFNNLNYTIGVGTSVIVNVEADANAVPNGYFVRVGVTNENQISAYNENTNEQAIVQGTPIWLSFLSRIPY